MRKFYTLGVLLLLLFSVPRAYAHGISTATAKIEMRPGDLVELKIQFNLIDLLNHNSHKYSLPIIAALSDEKFAIFYKEIKTLFKQKLLVKVDKKKINTNNRFPNQSQIFTLLKREFIERNFLKKQNELYTFSDRRFYQVFYFDFKLKEEDLDKLSIKFPNELGTIYVTFTQSKNKEVHHGKEWWYQNEK